MDATKDLLAAARVGDAARVARALRHGADANATDWMQQTPLFLAAKDGHVAAARALLQAGAQPDARDNYGSTPLTLAAEKGFQELVALLLQYQADVNHATHDGDTLLMSAALRGHERVITALLDAGADVDAANRWGATALHVAALHGHVDVVRRLLEAGAQATRPNAAGKTPLDEAERKRHTQVAQLLRQFDGSGAMFLQAVRRGDVDAVRRGLGRASLQLRGPHERTAVHIAAKYGRLDVLKLLVSRGAALTDRDDALWTPLHYACENGDVDVVRFLLSQRVDDGCVDDHGRTAMDIAAVNGRLDVVKELCRFGVSLKNVSLDDRTILHRAVTSKNTELIEFLVNQRVDVNAVDMYGWTALQQAVSSGLVPVVTKLLAVGADVNALTTANRTDKSVRESESALHLAIRSDHKQILSLLLAHSGVDLNIGNHLGRTPLIFAASLDRENAASLLIKAGANVNAQGDAGESALLVASYRGSDKTVLELLQNGARTDLVAKSGRTPLGVAKSPEVRDVIQLYHNSQQYQDKCFAYLNGQGETPTIGKLRELVPLITSVYDMRHMLTLVAMCDADTTERKELLNAAFHHVVDHKLTFDDDACVFFKLSLERCERDKLLPREDFLLLDRKAEKVNTESAAWVVEMKKQVYANSWRLDAHDQHLDAVVTGLREVHAMVMENRKVLMQVTRRVGGLQRQVNEGKKLLGQLRHHVNHMSVDMRNIESRLSHSEDNIERVASNLASFKEAYVDRQRQEERNQKIKRVCGIVASVAGFVFAPVLKEVADAVVDFINPVDIVEKVYGEPDIAGFLSENSQKVLPKLIQDQLEKYAIPQEEFEALLREEIVLQHPEYLDECTKRGWSVNVDGGQSDVARTEEKALASEEVVVLQIVSELRALCSTALSDKVTRETSDRSRLSTSALPDRPHRVEQSTSAVTDAFAESCSVSVQQQEEKSSREAVGKSSEDMPVKESKVAKSPATVSSTAESPDIAGGEIVFVDDLDDFHFHAAVRESQGNVEEFSELIEMIDTSECDPNTPMAVQLRSTVTTQETLCAAAYAYRKGYPEIGDFLVSRMENPPAIDKTPASSVELLDDPEDFPFIYAVEESEGDVEECKHLILSLFELVDEQDHGLDAAISATVVRETSVAAQWTPVDYACHLGYEALVKFMLKELYKTSIPMKTKFQLLKVVRERSARSTTTA